MNIINLDHISSNPLLPEVKEAMIAAIQEDYHNPSSQHKRGEAAAEVLDKARKTVAALINASNPSIMPSKGLPWPTPKKVSISSLQMSSTTQ